MSKKLICVYCKRMTTEFEALDRNYNTGLCGHCSSVLEEWVEPEQPSLTQSDKTVEEILQSVITEKMAQTYLVETEGHPGDAEERAYFNTEAGKEYREMLIKRAIAALTARENRMVQEVIGEDLRPIFSGHTDSCITCGEVGGICEDPDCSGLGGLNDHELGEHKSILCLCERINSKLAEQRNRYAQLTHRSHNDE